MSRTNLQNSGNEAAEEFLLALQNFAQKIADEVSTAVGDWSIKGLIDSHKNVYSLSFDTKLISKVLEIQMLPLLMEFSNRLGYDIIHADKQNWYPDMSFVNRSDPTIKFAIDIKTTYRLKHRDRFCNGFTLGSHGRYFRDRKSTKNVQFPYGDYTAHLVLGAIYSRLGEDEEYTCNVVDVENIDKLQSVIGDIVIFAVEKWRIASYRSGSGNTANIGSINHIPDILNGNGVFVNLGEDVFNEYWINYGILQVPDLNTPGKYKPLTLLTEFLNFKGIDQSLINVAKEKKKRQI